MIETILLHACCAPCSTVGIAQLLAEGHRVALYFYGGNIHPMEEWQRRLESLQRLARAYSIPLMVRPYDPAEWSAAVAGLEAEPEGGARCAVCMQLQLRAAARKAVQAGATALCTSLTLSPQKHPSLINAWGQKCADAFGLNWQERVWRKHGGFAGSVQESQRLGLYRQNFCGCRYSWRQEHN